ncbi:MAG TPA: tetratricopeptide repeat protein [Candidatus Aminicenantes bacterium]|nr:tetratricopeptide repeat protein [Candidatus Aminicenantes bacterium]HRY64597.1 tetratricopeptide repeat protein [Candidatus Aminicenantes bacterium]HRZ71510.1 tetratricopeptide repeat protein [Candidatus Aminicenantes bacterium]
MRPCRTVILTLLGLALALSAQDDRGRGRISGSVVDETGAAVQGAAVVAESSGGGTRIDGKTDKKGHFALMGLGTGAWRVTASKDGFIAAGAEIQVSQIKTNPPVALTLKSASGLDALKADDAGRELLERGGEMLKAKRYDEALAAFEEFARKYPDLYAVRLNIGAVYAGRGELDKAEAEFRVVLDKDAGSPEGLKAHKETALRALSGLGEAALERGDLAAAQEHFRRILEISPEDQAAAYNVAEIFFSNQRIDEAITYFEQAARIKKDWPKIYHRLGLAYLNKGDLDKAAENLNKFLELDPGNPEAANVAAAVAAIEKTRGGKRLPAPEED